MLVLAISAAASVPNNKASLDPEIVERIDAFGEAVLSCRNMVGMTISAVKGGQMVYSKGFGVIDQESQRPVTPDTLFAIGSVSKHFTSALLGKFLLENKYDLI